MSTCVRKCATRVSENLRYLHFSSTAPKYRHLFRLVTAKTHAGGNLARQGAALAMTVAYCAQHNSRGNAAQIIILLVSSALQWSSAIEYSLVPCPVESPSLWSKTSANWLFVSAWKPRDSFLWLLSQQNCSVFLICWRMAFQPLI